MNVLSVDDFFQGISKNESFYVGFLRLNGAWIPLCALRDPETSTALDMIYISRSFDHMAALTSAYADKVAAVERTFVQFLMPEEIRNLVKRYALSFVAKLDEETGDGCGCGCGCGG